MQVGLPQAAVNLPIHVMEDNYAHSPRPSSSMSSLSLVDEVDYAGEVWDELEMLFHGQEEEFLAQDGYPSPHNTPPSTPAHAVNQQVTIFSQAATAPASPTTERFNGLNPVSTTEDLDCRAPISTPPLSLPLPISLEHIPNHHTSTPFPQHNHTVSLNIAPTMQTTLEVPRVSPSLRFFVAPDQIEALNSPQSWLHGAVISVLGDMFCHTSKSRPRNQCYDILPTTMLELWRTYRVAGTSPVSRQSITYHLMHATKPSLCRAWLVPVLYEQHWHLLVIDWIQCTLQLCDSLGAKKTSETALIDFGSELIGLAAEDWDLVVDETWNILGEQVGPFQSSLIPPLTCSSAWLSSKEWL